MKVLFADLSTWEGSDFGTSPIKGVLKVIFNDVTFSGWDHYGVDTTGGLVKIGVWKTDDVADPYFGKGMFWTFWPDGKQERSVYLPNKQMPQFPVIRRGQWVSDEIARSVGLL
jgi:hypothetical protein